MRIEGCHCPVNTSANNGPLSGVQKSETFRWNLIDRLDRSNAPSPVLNLTNYKLSGGPEYTIRGEIGSITGLDSYANDFSFLDYDGQMSMDEFSELS